jgi:hypothetical protein
VTVLDCSVGDASLGIAGSSQNIFANAMVGGVASVLEGGKFGHGFFAAGFASAFKPMINKIGAKADLATFRPHRVAVAAIIGGTGSVISGGKFANGAATGAFNQMFNGEVSLKRVEKIASRLKWGKSQIKAFGKIMVTISSMADKAIEMGTFIEYLEGLNTEELVLLARTDAFKSMGIDKGLESLPDYLRFAMRNKVLNSIHREQLTLAAKATKLAYKGLYTGPLVNMIVGGTPEWFQKSYALYSDVKFAKSLL